MDNIASSPPMLESNNFLAPLLVSMAGISSVSIVIFLYHFFLVKFCRLRRSSSTGAPLNAAFALEISDDRRLPAGLDPKLLQTIPTVQYLFARKSADFRVDQSECVVCLGEIEDDDVVRLLPDCKHAFHVPCIDRWFVGHANCPVCRSPLNFQNGDYENKRNTNSSSLLDNDLENNNNDDGAAASSSSTVASEMQSCGLLRHCASLVLPMERRTSPKRVITGLRRSISLDQSFVIVDMQTEDDRRNCSPSPLTTSRLLVSFSRFHMGKRTEILPY